MCGRFLITADGETLQACFRLKKGITAFQPRYNIAPGQELPVVREADGRICQRMVWGLVPGWARDPGSVKRVINARAESISQKPYFRDSFLRRRCLIPASGFFEWETTPEGKNPFLITLPGRPLFAFAGIWDCWRGPGGEELLTCCIVTTGASDRVRLIHQRMPVILADPGAQEEWLRQGGRAPELLRPYQGPLELYPVSREVNNPTCDHPGLLRRVERPASPSRGGLSERCHHPGDEGVGKGSAQNEQK